MRMESSHESIDSINWKAYSRLTDEWEGQDNTTLAWTSEVLEEAFVLYQSKLMHAMKYLVIPEEWKTLIEETDTLSAVLCRTLKRYFDYVVELSQVFRRPKSYISYADSLEIESLPFPSPQLVPKEPDSLKYYTRLSRALLHMFSYPGMTTCRLEADAERNTSLLIYSLFDWFGIIQSNLTSSVNEMIDSIRIFKRDAQPQWTTNGLVPIIFYPERLQSTSEQRRIAWILQGGWVDSNHQLPSGLIPLTAAVEPTLELLLAYSIAEWKEKRTKDDRFVLPDWLFIHGVIYSPAVVALYSFIPKILEFTCDGVPSRWEFICVPTEPFDYELFSSRQPHERTFEVAILLAIKRHTDRICRVLDGLKPDCELPGISKPNIQENHRSGGKAQDEGLCQLNEETCLDGVQVDDDLIHLNGGAELATRCLSECILRTGLNSCCWDNWRFLDTPLDIQFKTQSNARQSFIVDFVDNWRSKKILLPEDWFTAALVGKESLMGSCEVNEVLPKLLLQIWTRGQHENFHLLTEDELHARHCSNLQSFSPDFLLTTPARKERQYTYKTIKLDDIRPTTVHCLDHLKDVYQYVSHELEAKMAISSPFLCTPGCWLRYDTQSRFPPALASATSPVVDFSLLLHPVQTVPIPMSPFNVHSRFVAIQGPTLWPEEFACSPASSHSFRPKDKSEALRQLAKAVEPSLKTHLINWQLRFEQGLVPTRDLPPWFMLFGLIYDAKEVTIVAHIPHMQTETSQYTFISCIVDTISFPWVDGSSKTTDPWYLDRFRVGLALLSLQKHAFNMAGLWECVVWPNELVSWEEIVEREYLGPVLRPSERGYMTEPHPMERLYRHIHGSDETVIDHSGEVSECEEEDGDDEPEDSEDDGDSDDGGGYDSENVKR